MYELLYLTLWLSSFVGRVSPVVLSNNCQTLPTEFSNLFLTALDELEDRLSDDVDIIFDEAGLGPFGTSLLAGNIYNFRTGLFEQLFGTSNGREAWINDTKGSAIDISTKLNTNVISAIGVDSLDITYVLLPDKKYIVDLTVHGSLPSVSLDGLDPQISLLPPGSFLPMGLNASTVGIGYDVKMPFTLYHGFNKFVHHGETQAILSVHVDASISETLPILSNKSISFHGIFDFDASHSYSSIHGFVPSGRFYAILNSVLKGNEVGLNAHDDDIFDSNPCE